MTLRVAQVSCLIDRGQGSPVAVLRKWPTIPMVAEAAARSGCEVTVLQSSHTSATHRENGVCYRFVAEPQIGPGPGAGLAPWRIKAALRDLRPDVVHFHGLAHPLHLRASCAAGAPVLVQDHASRPGGRGRLARRWSMRRATACAFTSADQAADFFRTGDLPPDIPILAVPECSTRFTAGNREAARSQSGVYGEPALLWVGRLNANKDPLLVLRSVRRALDKLAGLHLWCAYGAADLLPECEAILGDDPLLAERVHLLGKVAHQDIETLCRACDLFVSASRFEGSGYALLEAIACGLAPVVSDIPSFRALTGTGEIGRLVPVGDGEGLADAIVAQGLSPTPRVDVLRLFDRELSPNALGRKLVETYRIVMAGGR